MMKRLLIASITSFITLASFKPLIADQTEAAATNLLALPSGSWISGIQINQLTFNETEGKHDGHNRGKIGISQTSFNGRSARGGTLDSPEIALYYCINRYKFTGHKGRDLEPKAHYLPFFGVGGFYDADDTFRLNYLAAIQLNVNHWNLFTSTRYVGMLAGRTPIGNFGIDYGMYILTGTRRTQAYPLIGFDYEYDKWTFKAIYPLEISLRHQTTNALALFATTRWNNDRFRLSEAASRKEGFIQAQSYGVELGFEWTFFKIMKLGFSFGENFNSTVATYNHMGKDADHYRLKPAFYNQINLSCVF